MKITNAYTTGAGIVAAAGVIVKWLCPIVGIPPEVGDAILVVGVGLIGYFAKGTGVTGTGSK